MSSLTYWGDFRNNRRFYAPFTLQCPTSEARKLDIFISTIHPYFPPKNRLLMKHLAVLLFPLFTLVPLSSTTAQITPYSHYLDASCTWYEFGLGSRLNETIKSYITYFIDGDTVINNQAYFKQYYVRRDSNISWLNPRIFSVTTQGRTYFQALREDSLDRFYRISHRANAETLIHDFRLLPNDLFPNESCTISSIDSVILGTSPLKRFHSSAVPSGGKVIEGIGATGLLCGIGIESSFQLVCFQKQDNWLHLGQGATCDEFPEPIRRATSIAASFIPPPTFSLYPNPTQGILHLRTQQAGSLSGAIIDPLGKKVQQVYLPRDSREINVKALPEGIYFLVIDGSARKFLVE